MNGAHFHICFEDLDNTMTLRPRFKHYVHYEPVPPQGVVLFSERGQCLLRGTTYLWLAPLLDGQHTVEEIFSRIPSHIGAAEVFWALETLRRQGYLTEAVTTLPKDQMAFWELVSDGRSDTRQRLQETSVSLITLGDISPAPFRCLLAELGIRESIQGDLWIVLTDDYLRAELADLNQCAVTKGIPWMLVKPVGTEIGIGPLFLPEHTGCWECLAQRVRGHRQIEHYLQKKNGKVGSLSLPRPTLPTTQQTAFSIAATEVAKWIASGRNESLAGQIVTFDTLTLDQQRHVLVRRPQCPTCGNPRLVTEQQTAPLVLQSHQKRFTTDGGHRSFSPEETCQQLAHHISPLTGIIKSLRPTSTWVREHRLTPTYVAEHHFAHDHHAVHMNDDWSVLNDCLFGRSGGKGKHDTQAKASGLCEAIERYSGIFQGDEARVLATAQQLGAAVIHPNTCMLFSQRQFSERTQWDARASRFNWVPEPFDETQTIEWSPAWSLTNNRTRYVPTAYCYYGYSRQHQTWFARADSNGCASGRSKEEAILQGFMELVERDCVALWWYNRLTKPLVDLASFPEPYFRELQAYYHSLHRDLWVLDITSDLGIPAFVAVSRRTDKAVEDIILGCSAHFDPQLAIQRALTEVSQSLPAVLQVTDSGEDGYISTNPEALNWWKTATIASDPYLAADEQVPLKVAADYARDWSDDLADDVRQCVQIAADHGLETLVLDQTRPDVGLHVVKVMVPGLRHFWARFGPGRLYDVPVRMGWLPRSLNENELNPQMIYF